MNRILIICKLSCTFSCAKLRCSVSWVSSIKKGKANTQEIPARAHSPFSSSSTPSCLVLYPHRVKPPGRADHSSRLRGIDVCVRGAARTHAHTQEQSQSRRGKNVKTNLTKCIMGKKIDCQCFICTAFQQQNYSHF